MTEQEAIERIATALSNLTVDSDEWRFPDECLDFATAAWNEMKAIAREDKAPIIMQSLLSPTSYPQYAPDDDQYIWAGGKRSYDKAGKHLV